MTTLAFVDEINQSVVNIPRAALVFARSIAYPNLEIDDYLTRLERMVALARRTVPARAPIEDRVDALSDFLFNDMNFRGNREAYDDPRNSYLNEVLDRRLGIPITLSVLWITIAQKLGLPAYGIGLPGHFIVGIFEHSDNTATQIYIDPYHSGVRLTVPDCDRLVRESTGYKGPFQTKWLNPIRPIDLLTRMLNNLCYAYIQREEWNCAISVIQHLLLAQPDSYEHLRDLGYVHMYAGSLRLSAQYLEEYLRRASNAPDFETVRNSLRIIAGRLALWN